MLHNVVTSDAQAARYREQGLWTPETLSCPGGPTRG